MQFSKSHIILGVGPSQCEHTTISINRDGHLPPNLPIHPMQSPFIQPQYAWQNAREHTPPKNYVYNVKNITPEHVKISFDRFKQPLQYWQLENAKRRMCWISDAHLQYSHCMGGTLFPGIFARWRLSGMGCMQQLHRMCVWYGVQVNTGGVGLVLISGRLFSLLSLLVDAPKSTYSFH